MQDREIIWIDAYEGKRMVTKYTIDELECKYCGSPHVVRFGTYKGIQRWWRKKCQRKFVENKALPKMKTPVRHIASALSMYYGGMSLNAIRRHLNQQYGYAPSESTIYG